MRRKQVKGDGFIITLYGAITFPIPISFHSFGDGKGEGMGRGWEGEEDG
jgi:hypothetical protein